MSNTNLQGDEVDENTQTTRQTLMMHQLSDNVLSLDSHMLQQDIILEMGNIYRTMSRLPLRSDRVENMIEIVLKTGISAIDDLTGTNIPINSKKDRIVDKYIQSKFNNIFDMIFNCDNTTLNNGRIIPSMKRIECDSTGHYYHMNCKITPRYENGLLIFKLEKRSYTTLEFLNNRHTITMCRDLFQKINQTNDFEKKQVDFLLV